MRIKKIVLLNLIISLSFLSIVCIETCLEITANQQDSSFVSETHQNSLASENCSECFVENTEFASATVNHQISFTKTETLSLPLLQTKYLVFDRLNFSSKRANLPHLLPRLKILHQLRI